MVKIIFRAGALFFTGKENGASAAGKLSPKERERLQSLCGNAKTHLHKSGQEARAERKTIKKIAGREQAVYA